ncbi:MAG: hypothetical protein GWN71_40220, partial [Gammaproteobacteria bacterium]|nr:hypothetical protein [Gemmatimonadota bacterium]NIU79547.1 hypothetical protein [Gammaproteobacteria bacterium]
SPLTPETFRAALDRSGYVTFAGHGGPGYLRLDDETTVRAGDLPALSGAVVTTAACNTFRPWSDGSIATAFVDRGAMAYAGFAYSPVAGYLLGVYEGLPLRHSWPDFPIGRIVRVQALGT